MPKPVESLVLDATPLITQSTSALQQYATQFYTTPGVRAELRDEHARNQLLLWADALIVRQPKQEFIDKVSAFAKLTGDYSVLSMNDVHIIALAYELEHEKCGDAGLRAYPGQKLAGDEQEQERKPRNAAFEAEEQQEPEEEDDGFQVVTRKKKLSRKQWSKQFHTQRRAEEQAAAEQELTELKENISEESENTAEQPTAESELTEESEPTAESDQADIEGQEEAEEVSDLQEEYDEDDDDGDWITPENLKETILKDDDEVVQEANEESTIPVALSTGDFSCQNVTIQIGLKLMNYVSGKQIKRVRNYMYRCHACFAMLPMPKSGVRKHFCPKCGGDTLIRCAVSVDTTTGKVTPHLKKNFQWITRGQVYSLSSPLSKSTKKQQGRAGYQHNKENRHKNLQDPVILREDQKEYAQALKDEAWARKKNEKMLQEWVGGGSADNLDSPFTMSHRGAGVRVGRGRGANANKGKRR